MKSSKNNGKKFKDVKVCLDRNPSLMKMIYPLIFFEWECLFGVNSTPLNPIITSISIDISNVLKIIHFFFKSTVLFHCEGNWCVLLCLFLVGSLVIVN